MLWLVGRSGIGRAMEAIREDETAAQVMGIDLARYRLGALLASAVLAGLAGALGAHSSSFIGPNEYGFEPAVTILSFALLGGIGTPLGPVARRVHPDAAARVAARVFRSPAGVQRGHHRAGGAVPARGAAGAAPAPARGMTALLQTRGLTRRYAGLLAVDSVDMAVQAGSMHALIGPNGAGKTTLFNLISGLVPPSDGAVMPARPATSRRCPPTGAPALGLARTFQDVRVFGAMTVLENVLTGLHPRRTAGLAATILRTPHFRREERALVARAREALDLVGLSARAEARAAALAIGEQRRLEIARAMAPQPALLLLDEPAAGMNPAETAALAALVRRIRDLGTTVLLVEHDMGFVMDISDAVTVLNFGRLHFPGHARTAARQAPDVLEAYLGHKVAARLAARARRAPA